MEPLLELTGTACWNQHSCCCNQRRIHLHNRCHIHPDSQSLDMANCNRCWHCNNVKLLEYDSHEDDPKESSVRFHIHCHSLKSRCSHNQFRQSHRSHHICHCDVDVELEKQRFVLVSFHRIHMIRSSIHNRHRGCPNVNPSSMSVRHHIRTTVRCHNHSLKLVLQLVLHKGLVLEPHMELEQVLRCNRNRKSCCDFDRIQRCPNETANLSFAGHEFVSSHS